MRGDVFQGRPAFPRRAVIYRNVDICQVPRVWNGAKTHTYNEISRDTTPPPLPPSEHPPTPFLANKQGELNVLFNVDNHHEKGPEKKTNPPNFYSSATRTNERAGLYFRDTEQAQKHARERMYKSK